MLAHADFDPLWLTLFGIWLVVMMVACFAFARAAAIVDARAEELPDREQPEPHPDDESTTDWSATTVPSPPPSSSRYEPLWRGTPAPKPSRPGQDD